VRGARFGKALQQFVVGSMYRGAWEQGDPEDEDDDRRYRRDLRAADP
jgi:hypothetical protein